MAGQMKERSRLEGYKDGLKGAKIPLFTLGISQDYLEGVRQGREALLKNKDLAERMAAKTGEKPTERVVERVVVIKEAVKSYLGSEHDEIPDFSDTEVSGIEWFLQLRGRIERAIKEGAAIVHHGGSESGVDKRVINIEIADKNKPAYPHRVKFGILEKMLPYERKYSVGILNWGLKGANGEDYNPQRPGFTIYVCKYAGKRIITYLARSASEIEMGRRLLNSLQPLASDGDKRVWMATEEYREEIRKANEERKKKPMWNFLES